MSGFTVGPLVIGANGEGTPGWAYNLVKGWYDTNDDQLDSDSRPGQDGSFAPQESYQSEATPSVEGVFAGDGPREVAQAKLLLRSLRNEGRPQLVSWDDHGVITQREVFVTRAVPGHSAGRAGFTFAIDMWSQDPALYDLPVRSGPVGPISRGEGGLRFDEYDPATGAGPGLIFPETYGVLGSDGRVTITNTGYASTYSVFEFIGGSSEGFTLTQVSTGRTVWVSREIPEGSLVKVNMRTGRVTIDGDENDISGSLRRDDWWATGPQTTEQVQLGVLGNVYGSPSLSATTSSAN